MLFSGWPRFIFSVILLYGFVSGSHNRPPTEDSDYPILLSLTSLLLKQIDHDRQLISQVIGSTGGDRVLATGKKDDHFINRKDNSKQDFKQASGDNKQTDVGLKQVTNNNEPRGLSQAIRNNGHRNKGSTHVTGNKDHRSKGLHHATGNTEHSNQGLKQSKDNTQHSNRGVVQPTGNTEHSNKGLHHATGNTEHSNQGLKQSKDNTQHSNRGVVQSTGNTEHSNKGLQHATGKTEHSNRGLNHPKDKTQHSNRGVVQPTGNTEHNNKGLHHSTGNTEHSNRGSHQTTGNTGHSNRGLVQPTGSTEHTNGGLHQITGNTEHSNKDLHQTTGNTEHSNIGLHQTTENIERSNKGIIHALGNTEHSNRDLHQTTGNTEHSNIGLHQTTENIERSNKGIIQALGNTEHSNRNLHHPVGNIEHSNRGLRHVDIFSNNIKTGSELGKLTNNIVSAHTSTGSTRTENNNITSHSGFDRDVISSTGPARAGNLEDLVAKILLLSVNKNGKSKTPPKGQAMRKDTSVVHRVSASTTSTQSVIERGSESIKPIEQMIEEATEAGPFAGPNDFFVSGEMIKFDGDIVMRLEDFIHLPDNETSLASPHPIVTTSLARVISHISSKGISQALLQNGLTDTTGSLTSQLHVPHNGLTDTTGSLTSELHVPHNGFTDTTGSLTSQLHVPHNGLTDNRGSLTSQLLLHLLRTKRAARRKRSRYWPRGEVPIRIDGKRFRKSHKRRMARGMNEISQATCICFRIITEDQAKREHTPHVRVVDGNGCSSYVGMVVREQDGNLSQELTMNRRCRNSRVFSHELLHSIGLYHEQSRPDRDDYVAINLKNVSPTRHINFRRIGTKSINTRDLPYDYLSIMHYSSKAYSTNGNHTIVPRPESNKAKYLDRIGRSRRLSQGDADVVNLMYGCSMPRPARPTCSDYPYRFP